MSKADFTEWQAFSAVMEEYPKMLEFVTSNAEALDIPMKRQMKLELGFEEAVVNVIHYAYDKVAPLYLRCSKALTEEGEFVVEIADNGKAFNPLEADENKKNLRNAGSIEEAIIGGLGIPFIKKIFPNVSYRREIIDGKEANRLVLPLKV